MALLSERLSRWSQDDSWCFQSWNFTRWVQEKDKGTRELGILQTFEAMGPESNPDREGSEDQRA